MKKLSLVLVIFVLCTSAFFARDDSYIDPYEEHIENIVFSDKSYVKSDRPIKVVCYKNLEQLENKFPNYIDKYSRTILGRECLFSLFSEDDTYLGEFDLDQYATLKELFREYQFIGVYLSRTVLADDYQDAGDEMFADTKLSFQGFVNLFERGSNSNFYAYLSAIGEVDFNK